MIKEEYKENKDGSEYTYKYYDKNDPTGANQPLLHPHHGTYYTEDEIWRAKDIINDKDYKPGSNKEAEVVAEKIPGEIKTGYFKTQEHINSWHYSPPNAVKQIETVFTKRTEE